MHDYRVNGYEVSLIHEVYSIQCSRKSIERPGSWDASMVNI